MDPFPHEHRRPCIRGYGCSYQMQCQNWRLLPHCRARGLGQAEGSRFQGCVFPGTFHSLDRYLPVPHRPVGPSPMLFRATLKFAISHDGALGSPEGSILYILMPGYAIYYIVFVQNFAPIF